MNPSPFDSPIVEAIRQELLKEVERNESRKQFTYE